MVCSTVPHYSHSLNYPTRSKVMSMNPEQISLRTEPRSNNSTRDSWKVFQHSPSDRASRTSCDVTASHQRRTHDSLLSLHANVTSRDVKLTVRGLVRLLSPRIKQEYLKMRRLGAMQPLEHRLCDIIVRFPLIIASSRHHHGDIIDAA